MKILSIDWDYFINCSASDRAVLFPDGGNERLGIAMSTYVWASRYGYEERLEKIKSRSQDIDKLKKIIEKNKEAYLYICADSHQHLGEFILNPDMEKKVKKDLTIVNIDHHHDMFGIGEELNCGNWLNKVLEKYPETKVKWIRNEDSNTENFVGEDSTNIEDADDTYDVIYICRSFIWSPPHLDKEFGVLNRFIAKRAAFILFRQEIANRWDDDFKKDVKFNRVVAENMRKSMEKIAAEKSED